MLKAVPIIDIFKKPEDNTGLSNVLQLNTAQIEENINKAFPEQGSNPVTDCKCSIWAYKNNDISTGQIVSKQYGGTISGIVQSAAGDLNGILTNVYGFEAEVDRITIVFVFIIEE